MGSGDGREEKNSRDEMRWGWKESGNNGKGERKEKVDGELGE